MFGKKRSAFAREVIPLSSIIEALREDLFQSAKKRTKDWKPLFEISQATVEISVVFERSAGVEGGVSVYAVNFGAKGEESSNFGHRITVTLSPLKKGDQSNQQKFVVPDSGEDELLRGE